MLALRFVMVKDGRAILRAYVRSLPVTRRRVMVLKEHVKELGKVDLGGIKFHFDGFSMVSVTPTDLLVGWVGSRFLTTRVADLDRKTTTRQA